MPKLASRYAQDYIGGERFLKPVAVLDDGDFYYDHYQAEIYRRDRNPLTCNYISAEGLICGEAPLQGKQYCAFHRARMLAKKS